MLERRTLEDAVDARYAAWNGELGVKILDGTVSLEELERRVADGIEPAPVSGGQERLENVVNRHIWQADRR
jgi:xylose isomerase